MGNPSSRDGCIPGGGHRTLVLNTLPLWKGEVVDLRDLVSYHQLTLASEGRSEKTQRQYLYFHTRFLEYLDRKGIQPELAALNPSNLRQAYTWYMAQTARQRSRGGEVGGRAFIDLNKRLGSFGEEEGVFEDNPLRKVKRVRITKHTREPFSMTELNALWGACQRVQQPAREEALFLLLLDTGMRIGEALGLRMDRLRLRDPDERYVLVGAVGKSRRERKVPIGEDQKRDGGRTVRALQRYLQGRKTTRHSGDAVFLGRDGYPLTASGANDVVHRLGAQAGVENTHPHRLRHTFCTNYLTANPHDELGLRRIVGHLSRDVMEDYVHLADATLRERAGRSRLSASLSSVRRVS